MINMYIIHKNIRTCDSLPILCDISSLIVICTSFKVPLCSILKIKTVTHYNCKFEENIHNSTTKIKFKYLYRYLYTIFVTEQYQKWFTKIIIYRSTTICFYQHCFGLFYMICIFIPEKYYNDLPQSSCTHDIAFSWPTISPGVLPSNESGITTNHIKTTIKLWFLSWWYIIIHISTCVNLYQYIWCLVL